jgi:hypothetical protein
VEAGASAVALAKADTQTCYGWQASLLLLKVPTHTERRGQMHYVYLSRLRQ